MIENKKYSSCFQSPIGELTAVSDGEHIVGLWISGQKYFAGTVKEDMEESPGLQIFRDAKDWLDRYFAGKRPHPLELPLAPCGSEFRHMVWDLLCEIPYGEVTSYGEIAKKIALKTGKKSMSAQAVGGAVGHNPISIIIPCHRVIGKNGDLTGYAGGLEIKRTLLALEGFDVKNFVNKNGEAGWKI